MSPRVGLGVYLIGHVYSMEDAGVEYGIIRDVEPGGKCVVTTFNIQSQWIWGVLIQLRREGRGVRE